ncbi:MAG: FtsX-like permease family protein [bacterium]|nr:FtsX-like permease family protein [bacterium]
MKKQGKRPPKISEYILSRMFPDNGHFTTVSDLEEDYKDLLAEKGVLYAELWYRLQILLAIPHFITGRFIRNIAMFKNYVKIALRNLQKNKLYSGINIISLAIAFGCCILILSFIRDEYTYDRFHEHADEIFEMYSEYHFGEDNITWTGPQSPLAPTLTPQFPEIKAAARVTKDDLIVRYEDRTFTETFVCVDPEFFDVFTFPLSQGNPEAIQSDINSLIISPEMAEKYFGDDDPIGKVLQVKISGGFKSLSVSGILRKVPGNSSLRPDFIVNIRQTDGDNLDEWRLSSGPAIFIRLESREQAESLEEKFSVTIDKNLHDKGAPEKSGYHLHSLTDFHLEYHFTGALSNSSNKIYSYVLSGISALVLIIAICNFVNLSVGGSSPRLKEIGIRKVFGAQRKQLIRQFWIESVMISFTAIISGVILSFGFLPTFNDMTQRMLSLDYLLEIKYLAGLCCVGMLVGIAAGSYPAVVMSRSATVDLFKKIFGTTGKNSFSRMLIVFQFVISIFFIISTLVISKQYGFMMDSKFGFDSEQAISLDLYNSSSDRSRNNIIFNTLRDKLLSDSRIVSVSASHSKYNMFSASIVENNNKERSILRLNWVDYNYLEFFGLKLIEGRDFQNDRPSDAGRTVIVNQAFLDIYDVESPIGKKLSNIFKKSWGDGEIIGVVENFHYNSLHHEIMPLYLTLPEEGGDDHYSYIYIKMKSDDLRRTLDIIKSEFNEVAPDDPFLYSFMDEEIAHEYESEKQYGRMFSFVSFFAIFIACSGLFGLTSLTVARRTKELSIRKVLGASVSGIMQLINRDFILLVLAGNLFAWPFAYFAADKWLQNFAFRINISPVFFITAGLIALLIAVITISLQTVRAALSNPVDTLRHE